MWELLITIISIIILYIGYIKRLHGYYSSEIRSLMQEVSIHKKTCQTNNKNKCIVGLRIEIVDKYLFLTLIII